MIACIILRFWFENRHIVVWVKNSKNNHIIIHYLELNFLNASNLASKQQKLNDKLLTEKKNWAKNKFNIKFKVIYNSLILYLI